MIITFAVLNLVDLAQTLWALRLPVFKEWNPIALYLYDLHPLWLVAYKLLFTAIACAIFYYIRKEYPKNKWVLLPVGIMVFVVSWNFLNIYLYLIGA